MAVTDNEPSSAGQSPKPQETVPNSVEPNPASKSGVTDSPNHTNSNPARAPAIITTLIVGGIVALSLWYLVQPQPILI